MYFLFRLILSVTIVLGIIAGFSWTQPRWVSDLGLDFWKLPELNHVLAEEQDRGVQLDAKSLKAKHASEEISRLIQDLIGQRLSLSEAISVACQSHDRSQLELYMALLEIEASDFEAGVGQMLIGWVQLHLKEEPQQAGETAARLEQELKHCATTLLKTDKSSMFSH